MTAQPAPRLHLSAATLTIPPDCLPPSEPAASDIVAEVCRLWREEPAQVAHGGRAVPRRTMLARRACVVALRRLCPSMTLSEIGANVGGMDHTTVLHHLRKAGVA